MRRNRRKEEKEGFGWKMRKWSGAKEEGRSEKLKG